MNWILALDLFAFGFSCFALGYTLRNYQHNKELIRHIEDELRNR